MMMNTLSDSIAQAIYSNNQGVDLLISGKLNEAVATLTNALEIIQGLSTEQLLDEQMEGEDEEDIPFGSSVSIPWMNMDQQEDQSFFLYTRAIALPLPNHHHHPVCQSASTFTAHCSSVILFNAGLAMQLKSMYEAGNKKIADRAFTLYEHAASISPHAAAGNFVFLISINNQAYILKARREYNRLSEVLGTLPDYLSHIRASAGNSEILLAEMNLAIDEIGLNVIIGEIPTNAPIA